MTDRQKYDVILHEMRRRNGEREKRDRQDDLDQGGGVTRISDRDGTKQVSDEEALWELVNAGFLTSENVIEEIRKKQAYYAGKRDELREDRHEVMGGKR